MQKKNGIYILVCFLIPLIYLWPVQAVAWEDDSPKAEELREKALKLHKARNYKQAVELFKQAIFHARVDVNLYFNIIALSKTPQATNNLNVYLYNLGYLYLDPEAPDRAEREDDIKKSKKIFKKKMGTVHFTSSPPHAEIAINGAVIGRIKADRFDLQLPAGEYLVEMWLPDFEIARKNITVTAEQESSVDLNLKKKLFFGYMELVSEPAQGVQAQLTNLETGEKRNLGKTPIERMKLPNVKFLLELEHPGYDKWMREFEIVKDEVAEIRAVLYKPESGYLDVKTYPEKGVSLTITNKSTKVEIVNTTPLTAPLILIEGYYTVKVTFPGYESKEEDNVAIKPRQMRRLEFKLTKQ